MLKNWTSYKNTKNSSFKITTDRKSIDSICYKVSNQSSKLKHLRRNKSLNRLHTHSKNKMMNGRSTIQKQELLLQVDIFKKLRPVTMMTFQLMMILAINPKKVVSLLLQRMTICLQMKGLGQSQRQKTTSKPKRARSKMEHARKQ